MPVSGFATRKDGYTALSASIWTATAIEYLQDFVRELAPDSSRVDVGETHAKTLDELLDTMIAGCECRVGTPAEGIAEDEWMEMVRMPDERGAF